MKSISLFVDNGTYLTRVHPFTKLMYIAAAISIPLISGRLWMFGVFIAVSLLVLASGKILKKTLPLIAFSFTILLTIFLIHGLFNQKNVNVLFQVVGLKFYRELALMAQDPSLPLRGAWIEISRRRQWRPAALVAPLTGSVD